ncbi:MAG: Mur ligase family protein, partial [Deltaproteobacteria bacterium]
MSSYKGKRVTVIGCARSGAAAAALLRRLGAQVFVTDSGSSAQVQERLKTLAAAGIKGECGGHTPAALEGAELAVLSPGVAPDAPPVLWARSRGVDVISEIELAASVCRAPIVAVTGTNGKTTTTTLIGLVARAAGRRTRILGNIGAPFSEEADALGPEDLVSLEVSSFQLEAIRTFRPRVAVVLNLTPDHLDRYADASFYLAAKKRITLNQGPQDWLVLNYGDAALRPLAGETRARVVFFNQDPAEKRFNENQMAVLAVARCLDIPAAVCEEVFARFGGVEHRLEFVRCVRGVDFINDSKATNIDSTVWALKNVAKPVVLIVGGRDKGSDFTRLVELVRAKATAAVVVGEAAGRIEEAWKGVLPLARARDLAGAVEAAFARARAG